MHLCFVKYVDVLEFVGRDNFTLTLTLIHINPLNLRLHWKQITFINSVLSNYVPQIQITLLKNQFL